MMVQQITGQDCKGHYGVREQDGAQVDGQHWGVQEPPAQEDGVDWSRVSAVQCSAVQCSAVQCRVADDGALKIWKGCNTSTQRSMECRRRFIKLRALGRIAIPGGRFLSFFVSSSRRAGQGRTVSNKTRLFLFLVGRVQSIILMRRLVYLVTCRAKRQYLPSVFHVLLALPVSLVHHTNLSLIHI